MNTEKPEIIVGIDIGVQGAIAIYNATGQGKYAYLAPFYVPDRVTPKVYDMPILKLPVFTKSGKLKKKSKKTIYNISKMVEIFSFLNLNKRTLVFIEEAQILPRGFTIKGNIGVARCQALFEGILKALGFEYKIINPKKWQHYFGIGMLKDSQGKLLKDTKEQSVKEAKKRFPQVSLETPGGRVLDGRADALLIMEYGRMTAESEVISD